MSTIRRDNIRMPAEAWDGLGKDIDEKIETLARITDEPGKLTRLYLNPAHKRSMDMVAGFMRDAGLTTRVDAAATVVGRLAGDGRDRRTLILGSHIDTVRDAGKYDGTLGVVAPIVALQRIRRAGIELPFDVEIVAFGDEEGVRYPTTLTGSRALAGKFDARFLDEKDAGGITREEALRAFGLNTRDIAREARDPARVIGYVEVHIEQGPVLEARNLPVGVVTGIAGATRGRVVVRGESGHAGTVPMTLRHDALATAAEMILAVEAVARRSAPVVATVGRLEVANGAVNTVPGHVEFTLDVRAPTDSVRQKALTDIRAALDEIATRRNVSADVAYTYDAPAVASDPTLVKELSGAVARQGYEVLQLASGAGHDAMSFGGRLPAAMLFVRCRGGVSHSPLEFATADDMDAAGRVLLDFILHLADAA